MQIKRGNIAIIDGQEFAPVKHGHWKNVNKEAIIPTGECSECGQWERVNYYCPNCGAKMDEEISNETD